MKEYDLLLSAFLALNRSLLGYFKIKELTAVTNNPNIFLKLFITH